MMLSLRDALGVPPTRIPIDAIMFTSYVLPPLVCYLVLAILAIIPQARSVRFALWLIFALLALRVTASLDLSHGKPELRVINAYLACAMFILTSRALKWTVAREPLVRYLRPGNSSPSIIIDALDLTINFRGIGWNWSHGFPFPRDSRPKNRIAFSLYTFLSAVAHILIFGVCQRATLSFRPPGHTTIGFSFYDNTLPFYVQHLRVAIIVFIQYAAGYSSLRAAYELATTTGVLFFGQDPAQWPPAFDAPWRATSVGEFWGRRWHQWFRHMFLFLGGYPFQSLFGRWGITLGGFLVSALMHGLMMIGAGVKEDAWIAFLMLATFGLVVFAERVFYLLTGNKVNGWVGWIWTVAWILLASGAGFDALAKTGAIGDSSVVDGIWPVRMLVERLVQGLDARLHTI